MEDGCYDLTRSKDGVLTTRGIGQETSAFRYPDSALPRSQPDDLIAK